MPKTYEELLGFKKMQKVAKERLQPPIINRVELSVREDHYKPIASENTGISTALQKSPNSSQGSISGLQISGSKLAIDYHRIADLATFERFMIEAIKIIVPGFQGVHTRVSKSKMTKEFNQRIVNYGSVVKEYEAKLAKIKEKRLE